MIRFDVIGTPAPKGSPKVVTKGRGGKPLPFPRVLADSEKTKTWAHEVANQAQIAMVGYRPFAGRPLLVDVTFRFVRPAGHFHRKTGELLPKAPRFPAVKPDIDKLVRNTLDPMHGLVFDDDSRVIEMHAHKVYALPGEAPGARIVVHALELA